MPPEFGFECRLNYEEKSVIDKERFIRAAVIARLRGGGRMANIIYYVKLAGLAYEAMQLEKVNQLQGPEHERLQRLANNL